MGEDEQEKHEEEEEEEDTKRNREKKKKNAETRLVRKLRANVGALCCCSVGAAGKRGQPMGGLKCRSRDQ